jgi:hypothetical protein
VERSHHLEDTRSVPQLSRRSLIGAALALGTFGAAAEIALPGIATAPAFAQTALDVAIAEAWSMKGLRLSIGTPTVNSLVQIPPWKGTAPPGDWCVWWATYIARSTGVGKHTSSLELYNSLPHDLDPRPGDFIYYRNSLTSGHTGFVVGVTNGVAQTVEGNAHGDPTAVTAYQSPWDDFVGFAHPPWASVPAPITPAGDPMPTAFTLTNGDDIALIQLTEAQQTTGAAWQNLPYTTGSTATNVVETTPGGTVFQFTFDLYIINLPSDQFVSVRLAYMDKATGVYTGFSSTMITGLPSGSVRGQYTAQATVDQTKTRVVLQAYASTTGVVIDAWRTYGLYW